MNHPTEADIVEFLERHAALLELDGASAFRVRAYANAARRLAEAEVDAVSMAARGTLTELDGVGKSVSELVSEFVTSGAAASHDELLQRVPATLLDLLRLPGLGLKKVKALYEATGIATLEALEAACRAGTLDAVSGFGRKTQDRILQGIELARRFEGHFHVHRAMAAAREVVEALARHPDCREVAVAGRLRRRCEVVEDIVLVAATDSPGALVEALAGDGATAEVIERGETGIDLRLEAGPRLTLHAVPPAHFPAALARHTGSRQHWTNLTERARAAGLRLDERGLRRVGEDASEPRPCADEAELYRALGLAPIPPELREGNDEVEVASGGRLPELVTAEDVRGILHAHSTYSDGRDRLADLAQAVRDRGYRYLGISDHSKTAAYASGLREDAVERQHEEIDALNERFGDEFHILKGIESDILGDGSLDYDDAFLGRFDFVIASIHSPMNMPADRMTARVVRALEHPATTILGHPSGRLLLTREEYPMDMDRILETAAAHGVAVEISAHPHRLDLDWRRVRQARDLGVVFSVNPDAHRIADLDYLEWGIGVARKGWLGSADVITCLDAGPLRAFFARS